LPAPSEFVEQIWAFDEFDGGNFIGLVRNIHRVHGKPVRGRASHQFSLRGFGCIDQKSLCGQWIPLGPQVIVLSEIEQEFGRSSDFEFVLDEHDGGFSGAMACWVRAAIFGLSGGCKKQLIDSVRNNLATILSFAYFAVKSELAQNPRTLRKF